MWSVCGSFLFLLMYGCVSEQRTAILVHLGPAEQIACQSSVLLRLAWCVLFVERLSVEKDFISFIKCCNVLTKDRLCIIQPISPNQLLA